MRRQGTGEMGGTDSDGAQAEANRITASLAALALTLALVVAGLYLVRALHDKAAVEDCLMAARLNCDAALRR